MRILVVTDLYPPIVRGGYELDLAATVAALRTQHDVRVLTSDLERERAPHDDAVVRRLPWTGADPVRGTLLAPIAAARALRLVRQVVDDVRPDLVLVSNCLGVPQAALAPLLGSEVPVIFRLAETFFAQNLLRGDRYLRHLQPQPIEKGVLRLWGALLRQANRSRALRVPSLQRKSVAVAWASADLRDRVALPAPLETRCERVIHPTSPHAAHFRHLVRQPGPTPTVLYLGRATRDKGVEVAYRALAEVHREHGVRAELLVVGTVEPKLAESLDALAQQLGVSDSVRRYGHLPPGEFEDLLRRAHVLVVPSLVQDVFPLVVVEAALARLPIVASRIGGIPEAVADREEALLFAPGDARACAAAVAQCLADPEQADERAARAFQRISRLTWEAYAAAWNELVEDVLQTAAAQPPAVVDLRTAAEQPDTDARLKVAAPPDDTTRTR